MSLIFCAVNTSVTHPLGCCRSTGHVHLLGVGHHPRVDGFRRCLLPSRNTRSAEGLRHKCYRSRAEVGAQFSTLRCDESYPRDSTILHQDYDNSCTLVVRFHFWFWCLPLPFSVPFVRVSTCIHHHLRSFHYLLTRSNSSQSFGNGTTVAIKRHCWRMYPTATFPKKIGGMFIITVHLTASANEVPEALSHSPTSSSQVLKPDSKPSAWSHQNFASIMICCIIAYCRF